MRPDDAMVPCSIATVGRPATTPHLKERPMRFALAVSTVA